MQKELTVQQIINLLKAKRERLQIKKEEFEGPVMQEIVKNNQAMQLEYLRACAQLEIQEDNLQLIESMSGKKLSEPATRQKKTGKKEEDKKE